MSFLLDIIYPCLEHLDLSNWSDLDDINDINNNESCHCQTHGQGRAKGTVVIEASGLSNTYYIHGL